MSPSIANPFLSDSVLALEARDERRPFRLTPGAGASPTPSVDWQRAVRRLHDWLNDPDAFDTDEIEVPTREVITAAMVLLQGFRDEGLHDDFFPSPNGRGGICFERRSGSLLEEYELEKDRRVSYRRYIEGRLIHTALLGWTQPSNGQGIA